MEKEALVISKSLEFFRDYVIGSKINIYTDNQDFLFNNNLSKRIQRWKLLLEEFNYNLMRIPEKNNIMADAISRITTIQPLTNNGYWNMEKLRSIQNYHFNEKHNSENNLKYNHNTEMYFDIKEKIIIPNDQAEHILTKLHHDLAHPGSRKLFYTIKKYIYIHNLKRN
ncbi:Retrovirus-related Pol polyprotein from transposon opus [Dictyocoela muelleri]|nr:Retrovirus-related Pol polyprotein from transposon opus [Dictyocoela muelleri]